ncbi:acetoin reductase family protein [Lactarius quietus]|nr:acetoin reductase family protein [Lactarius quietus]
MSPTTTKVALVTGAARGIGRAIAVRLAEDGFDVAVNDVPGTPDPLDEVLTEIGNKGRRALRIHADISLEPEVERIVKEVSQELGSLDVMVANAGIISLESFQNTTAEGFDRLMAVNARGTMLCYKHAGKQMIAQGRGGRIIGACSQAGKQASSTAPAYCASKFAVRGLTQAAAQEFGQYGITVNAYAPGVIDTSMIAPLKAPDASGNGAPALDAILGSVPVGRIGQPEDVAGLVSYLASDGAGFITGQCVSINGGAFFD